MSSRLESPSPLVGTFSVWGSCLAMREARYYRDDAARARRLLKGINHPQARDSLLKMARDYDDIAEDLESGAIEIRHPELMPQVQRRREAD